jgi:hypothetical protein
VEVVALCKSTLPVRRRALPAIISDFLKTLFSAASLMAATLAFAACDSKTATTGEAKTPSTAEAAGKTDSAKIDEAAPTTGTAAVAADEANAKPGPDPSTIPAA